MNVGYPVVRLLVPFDELELASADLWDLDTVGVEEVPSARAAAEGWAVDAAVVALQAGFASAAQAERAALALPSRWSPMSVLITDDSWLDAWREHFEPFRVGGVVVVPAWREYSPIASLDGDIVIALDPGRSFGTGAHPSTALVLALLQGLAVKGLSVLDVGCGSGILSVAAALLGSASVTAVDVEEAAVPTTVANAWRNGVAVSVSTTPVAALSGSWDIVLANILAPVLIDLAPDLTRLVAPSGRIILSGLIDAQRDRVVAAYPSFEVVEQRIEGVWIGLLAYRANTE